MLAAFGVAIALRLTGEGQGPALWIQIAGLLLLAPPLIWAGYQFVYDSELEPYRGSDVRNRVLILSAILAALWLVYAFAPAYVMDLESAREMDYITAGVAFVVMIGLGAVAAMATFELEFVGGLTLAGLYFIAVILLAVVSGVTLAGAGEVLAR